MSISDWVRTTREIPTRIAITPNIIPTPATTTLNAGELPGTESMLIVVRHAMASRIEPNIVHLLVRICFLPIIWYLISVRWPRGAGVGSAEAEGDHVDAISRAARLPIHMDQ